MQANEGCARCAGWLIFATLPSALLGCSDERPDRVPVSGQVLLDGVPLSQGSVRFVPAGGRPSIGKLDEQGRFTMTCFDGGDGVIPGKHRVAVTGSKILSETKIQWFAPPKYADFRTSGLEFAINEPNDNLKIELTWQGSPPGKPFVE
jgi:hypothetical protein